MSSLRVTVVVIAYTATPSPSEEASFIQCLRVLGRHGIAIVCPDSLELSRYLTLCSGFGIAPDVRRFADTWLSSVSSYNKFMLQPELYKCFASYDYILIYQLDAWVFKDDLKKWCAKEFTYIGAPFFNDRGEIFPFPGNGGFSLRHVASFIALLEGNCRPEQWNYAFLLAKIPTHTAFRSVVKRILHVVELTFCRFSPLWYCRLHREHEDFLFAKAFKFMGKGKVPSPYDAAFFAFERFPRKMFALTGGVLPFGCHAFEKYDVAFWRPWISDEKQATAPALLEDMRKQETDGEERRPLFSVITATYNAGAVLAKLLDSLAEQTCRDFELVMQDGGSDDDTLAVLESRRARLPSVSLLSENDSGIYDAWNKAVARARGKWFLFLGADDRLHTPEVLRLAAQLLPPLSPAVDFFAASMMWTRPDGSAVEVWEPAGNAFERLPSGMPVPHPALFYRRALFAVNRFSTEFTIAGDYEFLCRMLRKGNFARSSLVVSGMSIGGVSNALSSILACERESLAVSRRYFPDAFPILMYARIIRSAVYCLVTRLAGESAGGRFADAVRKIRSKPRLWT
jgi:hypothetical protein